ncbi:MAG: ATP-binding protein [Caulobacteraceae bacterium]
MAANSVIWALVSVVLWNLKGAASPFFCLVGWSCLIINASSFSFESPLAFWVLATPVALAVGIVPVAAPKFPQPQQTFVVLSSLLLLIYGLLNARRNITAGRKVRRTNRQLEDARLEAEAANSAKSAFLAVMSHEIRTPLNGVLGMTQAMDRDELPDFQRDRLLIIRQSSETLLGLLNDLLDLSRIEAGRLEIENSVIDVGTLVQGARATFVALSAEKDVSLEAHVAVEAEGLWRGDPVRVRQIVNNLISNAVKFTERGSVRVLVDRPAEHLRIRVADTGPGIGLDRIERLFDKFVQADASTTRRYGGSGLGLAICRELALLMGGSVTAKSVLGEGSTFTLLLPLQRADPTSSAPATFAKEEALQELEDELRILAAEDNPLNQKVLQTLLGQCGVVLTIVSDGEQAVEAAASGGFDLILMDIQMPVMDGVSATRAIRAFEDGLGRRTPIIALTANAMVHHLAAYQDAGMDGFAAKPIQLAQLLGEIDRIMAFAYETHKYPTQSTSESARAVEQ